MVADFKMNQEKLKQLQAQVRIGGKGTARYVDQSEHSKDCVDQSEHSILLLSTN